MGPVPRGTQGRLAEAPLGRDGIAYDKYTDDDVVSLREENELLRKLVISLSELVLRNVAEAKVTAFGRWPT
jgi:hypothetical protein